MLIVDPDDLDFKALQDEVEAFQASLSLASEATIKGQSAEIVVALRAFYKKKLDEAKQNLERFISEAKKKHEQTKSPA